MRHSTNIDILRNEVRALATSIKKQFGFSQGQFGKKINQAITANKSLTYLRQLSPTKDSTNQGKAWEKILDEKKATTVWNNYDKWLEMKQVLLQIQSSADSIIQITNTNTILDTNGSPEELSEKREVKIRYGIFLNHDTYLPYYHSSAYTTDKLNTTFISLKAWHQCLDKFEAGEIDVALHNLPTAIAAINTSVPLLFFPFFTFYGYGIFVKKTTLSKLFNGKTFKDLTNKEKRFLLETCNTILELGTDLEWVFQEFCKKYNAISTAITNLAIDEGRKYFLDPNKASDIYCTNSIHTLDLQNDDSLQLIAYGESYTNFKNINGLIVPKTFYELNKEAVHELIRIWFNSLKSFQRDRNSLFSALQTTQDTLTSNINSLHWYLKGNVGAKISLQDFLKTYSKTSNSFFDGIKKAKEYFNGLSSYDIEASFEIAELQMGDSLGIPNENMKSLINSLLIEI